MKLEPMKIQHAKRSTAFLKNGKDLEKGKFLVNLSDLMSKFIFSELKAFFCNPFSKRLFKKDSYYLPLSLLGDVLDK